MPEASTHRTGTGTDPGAHGPAEPHSGNGPAAKADSPAPRRRQARGERRIEQLLEAAGSVFCQVGYQAASTNAIAREAGVSPGTLYQFFPNKESIAVELGGRLLHQWFDSHGRALADIHVGLPPEQLLNSILDPMIDFNLDNPAFTVLIYGGPDVPGRILQEFEELHTSFHSRVEAAIGAYFPHLSAAQRFRTATMTHALFRAGMDVILTHEGTERQAYIGELKAVFFRYLAPLLES